MGIGEVAFVKGFIAVLSNETIIKKGTKSKKIKSSAQTTYNMINYYSLLNEI